MGKKKYIFLVGRGFGGMKRTSEEAIANPTLGQVAKEKRFESLRDLIRPVTTDQ
jgi:hypothetical protein